MTDINQPCLCQSGAQSPKTYDQCCRQLHSDMARALTPEQLMRSRYSAFCLGNAQYLSKTHHPSQRHNDDDVTLAATIVNTQWHGLTIVASNQGQNQNEGYIEFIAHYSENQQPGLLHEKSRFVKENEQWFYIDGEIMESGPIALPNRNEPCWCGNGKKFKKCHG
jgi:SEC-C motif-containing protein|tara:strand:+ start:1041 stop:1535 length:495 start_codon:yes stop_codon:yes gene_type:complete